MPRRRPLCTCVASIFAIIHIACTKVDDLHGPMGLIIHKITIGLSYIMPILYTMQFQWLSILSFVDNCLLTSQIMIEKLLPSSSRLFDKMDELAYAAESLPEKIDDIMEQLPIIIHQLPFLDWTLVNLVAWLNFWISCLTPWGNKNAREKEITVDMSIFFQFPNSDTSQEQNMASEKSECGVDKKKIFGLEIQAIEEAISPACSSTCDPFEDAVSSPIFYSHEDVISKSIGIGTTNISDAGKYSYKEMLEKGSVGKNKEDNLSIVY
ncbi:unnamed protein product [Withania somnifera]